MKYNIISVQTNANIKNNKLNKGIDMKIYEAAERTPQLSENL